MQRRDAPFAAGVAAVLAAYNNVVSRYPWHERRYVLVNLGASGILISAAKAAGLSDADLGLGRGWWRPGRLAAGLAAGICAGWILIAATPATRPVLADRRNTSFEPRAVAYQAAVRIPLGTVLWEEIAFRGVLQAALRRVLPHRTAMLVNAGVFGAWHLYPTHAALRANGLVAGRPQEVTRAVAGSAAMAVPGVLLSWLRDRSGRLAAPALVHLAANSGAMIAAALTARHRATGRAPGRS